MNRTLIVTALMAGAAFGASAQTVDTYRSRLMAKLDLADVPALVRWAIREKLIDL